MRPRIWLMILIFVATIFSGCTETGPDETGPTIITDPDDFSYLNNATDREHVHNYWGGQDRLQIADTTYSCGGQLLTDPVVCAFRPDDPIPLGTGRIDVTIAWTERPDQVSYYGETELWVKTSADNQTQAVSVIESGQTVTVEVTNEQNDLPHQRLSAWEFALHVYGEDRNGINPVETQKRFYADVDIQIVAYKTLEIPTFPGHPDIWQNRTEFALVTDYRYPTDDEETTVLGRGTRVDDRRIRPDAGVIVPVDGAYIELVLESSADEASESLRLDYHDATSREWQAIDPVEVDGDRQVYHIPVGSGGDSPYALQSMWEFHPRYDYGPGGPSLDYYNGYYTASATVYKEPPA